MLPVCHANPLQLHFRSSSTQLNVHVVVTAAGKAAYEPELPGQMELPEDWDQTPEEKTALQKFLRPDEADLPSDFAVSAMHL